MDKVDFIEFCAEFWQIDRSEIRDEMQLDDTNLPNNSSIRFYQFIAMLEAKFGLHVQNINSISTFGDLYLDLTKSREHL